MGKTKKKPTAGPSSKTEPKKLNPFEVHINRQKFEVLGRKLKSDRGLPGVSKSKAIKKRKATLLQEYKNRTKTNRFVDKRIGERDPNMTAEDKITARFTATKLAAFNKKTMFNLADDEVLTHRGRALTDIEKFDDPRSDEDDEDEGGKGGLSADFVKAAHFGGGLLKHTDDSTARSRKDIIDQLIVESKKRKLEQQKQREETLDQTEKLDTEWRDLLPIIAGSSAKADEGKKVLNDYDMALRELKFEARGKPSDRLKTEEEIAREEKEELQRREEERQKRMHGFKVDVDVPKHKSADDLDDGFDISDVDDEEDEQEAGASTSKRSKTEFDDLTEDADEVEEGESLGEDDDDESGEEDEGSEEEDDDEDDPDGNLDDLRYDSESEGEEENEEDEEKMQTALKSDSEDEPDEEMAAEEEVEKEKEKEEDDSEDDPDEETAAEEQVEKEEDDSDEESNSEESDTAETSQTEKGNVDDSKSEGIDADRVKAIKADLLERKALMDAARKELPYVFEIPETLDDFSALMAGHTVDRQAVIMERIVKCNHPSLAVGNKDKLSGMIPLIIQHIHDAALGNCEVSCWALLERLSPHLYNLAEWSPREAANTVVTLLKTKQEEYRNERKVYPDVDTLIVFKIVSQIFETSDFRHPVSTPAMVFMCQLLNCCRVKSRRDIACGLLLTTFVLEYTAVPRRFCPAAINFLLGVVRLADPTGPRGYTPFKRTEPCLLRPRDRPDEKALPPEQLTSEELETKLDVDDTFRQTALKVAFGLLSSFIDLLQDLSAFRFIFRPFLPLLENILRDDLLMPKSKQLVESIQDKIKEYCSKPLDYVVAEKKKPKVLKLYEPSITPVFADGKTRRPMSREKQEHDKLVHKYKREMKGAIREIRKDRNFLAKMKFREQRKSDLERRAKVKEIFGSAASQQGELNAMERKKNKKK